MKKTIEIKLSFSLFKKKLLSSTKKKKNPVNVRANHQRRQMTASDSDSDWVNKSMLLYTCISDMF